MPGLKILTWNINGIRACKLPLKQQLDTLYADVICLQETKVTRDQLDEITAVIDGYNSYFSFSRVRSGYSGVATYVKNSATPFRAEDGLSGGFCTFNHQPIGSYGHDNDFTSEELIKLDSEGRCIITEHRFINSAQQEKSLVVINVYCPRADLDNAERLSFKLRFYRLLQQRAEAILTCNTHVIILGDINTSHRKIDHCDPDADAEFNDNPGRQWMNAFVSSCEDDHSSSNSEHKSYERRLFFDTYRWLHPDEQNAFTCWRTSTGARQTNYGTRIDYILADFGLLPDLTACSIMAHVEGSDHCPVKVEFNCSPIAASTCPSLCTKYFPQFAGRQQKLLQYLAPKFSIEKNSRETRSIKRSTLSGGDVFSSDDDINGSENHLGGCVSWNNSSAKGLDDENEVDERDLCYKSVEHCSESSEIVGSKCQMVDFLSKKIKKSRNCDSIGGGKQSNLLQFFVQPQIEKDVNNSTGFVFCKPNVLTLAQSKTSLGDMAAVKVSLSSDLEITNVSTQSDEFVSEFSRTSTVSAWKSLLKGPPRNVLCNGHKEPCVLRTVKKDGPNKGKQFWTCSRPEGHKTNPDARCDYFLWVSNNK